MTSIIINMAEKIKDAEDRFLEQAFRTAPIDDDGFSDRVLWRIRRQIWLRRLALPVAFAVGGVIALKPLIELMNVGATLLSIVPWDFIDVPTVAVPQAPFLMMGSALLIVVMLSVRMLEE